MSFLTVLRVAAGMAGGSSISSRRSRSTLWFTVRNLKAACFLLAEVASSPVLSILRDTRVMLSAGRQRRKEVTMDCSPLLVWLTRHRLLTTWQSHESKLFGNDDMIYLVP